MQPNLDNATFYVDESLNLRSAQAILAERRIRAETPILSPPIIPLPPPQFNPLQYPVSKRGTLEFGQVYPISDPPPAPPVNYCLPTYQVQKTSFNGVSVPEIRFQWSGSEVVDSTGSQVIATLVVKLEALPLPFGAGQMRSLDHDLNLALTYYALDANGNPQSRISLPFDQRLGNATVGVTASMKILDLERLTQLVRALSKPQCQASLELTATAPMSVPGKPYVVDMLTLQSSQFQTQLAAKGAVVENLLTTQTAGGVSPVSTLQSKQAISLEALQARPGVESTPMRLAKTDSLQSAQLQQLVRPQALNNLGSANLANLQRRPMRTVQPLMTQPNGVGLSAQALRRIEGVENLPTSPIRPRRPLEPQTTEEPAAAGSTRMIEALETTPFTVGGKKALLPLDLRRVDGEHLYVTSTLQAQMRIDISLYDPRNYGQIYEAIPDAILDGIWQKPDPTVLVLYNLAVDGKTVVVYQDPLQKNLFYYTPRRFKLGRADNPPFEPLLRIGFKELVLAEANRDQAELAYQVEVTFTALPWAEESLYAAVQASSALQTAAAGQPIVLAPLDRGSAELELADLATYNATMTSRSISLATGVTVTLEMGATDFKRLFAALTQDAGVPALSGKLKLPLGMGSSQPTVDLAISLFDVEGPVFSQQVGLAAGDPPGVYRVNLKNETESLVKISQAHAGVKAEVAASALVLEPLPLTLEPGTTHSVPVKVTPETALVSQLELTTQHAFPTLNLQALWQLITINQGVSSFAFEIDVELADPSLLGTAPAEDIPPLTALKVEFQEGPTIQLTSDEPTRARLYKSVLADLQGQPLQESYTYRVTNIHGNQEWARGNWIRSSGRLRVMPVFPGEG